MRQGRPFQNALKLPATMPERIVSEAPPSRDSVLAAEAKAVWYSTHFLSLCDFDQTAQPSQIRITGTADTSWLSARAARTIASLTEDVRILLKQAS